MKWEPDRAWPAKIGERYRRAPIRGMIFNNDKKSW
jgi:hypothetical protein